jgi:DNA-binding MarR family transcriptional regulator
MDPRSQLTATLQKCAAIFMRRSMRQVLRIAKEDGLSMSQVGAMLHIHRMGVSGVSDIGDDLRVSSAAASQMLDRLVGQGLVVRSEDPRDRRVKQIVLTEAGQRRLQEILHARQGWLESLADLLTPEEQTQIVAALKTLIERADQLEDKLQEDCH